jgi:hypothetical protein
MGLVKGNPLALVVLFFGAAVVSMGGLYALAPALLNGPSVAQIVVAGALGVSLFFSILVVARVFWVVGKPTRNARAARAPGKR